MLIEEKLGNKVYFRNIIILHPEITSVDHSVYFHVNLSRFIFLFTKLYHNVCLCVYTHAYGYICSFVGFSFKILSRILLHVIKYTVNFTISLLLNNQVISVFCSHK